MPNRSLVLLILAALAWASLPGAALAGKGDQLAHSDLKETLEKGLKARRPQEFRFIARVVDRVKAGTLPENVVKSAFQWARKKPRLQFQFFERALTLQAAKLGISI